MAELHHECGIAALCLLPGTEPPDLLPRELGRNVSRLLPRMLLDLQNRGQLAAGITSYHPDRPSLLATHKDLGSVYEAFRINQRAEHERLMRSLDGTTAIGHVRYATCGVDDRDNAQPFERQHGCKWKWFAFAWNGQLANYPELAASLLKNEGYHLVRDTDTEAVMHCLAYELRGETKPAMATMFRNLAAKFDGSWNLVYADAQGGFVAARDPLGIRPLCWARDGGLIGVASESVALYNLGFREIRSLAPGEMMVVEDGEVRFERLAPPQGSAHCFFEWIYFANAASTLDDRSVYQARAELGRELARSETLPPGDDLIVVPVPDTAKAAADAMAFELGVPSMEGLLRNRYVGRTFIQGTQDRLERVRLKYTPLREVLEGKRVLLVEDTIVRSTTMRSLLHLLRGAGAKEVHVRVACPPIMAPCYYGIDMSTIEELFAPRYVARGAEPTPAALAAMAAALGADSLRYLPVEALARAVGKPASALCQACVDGLYPTPKGRELYQLALNRPQEIAPPAGRAYDRAPANG